MTSSPSPNLGDLKKFLEDRDLNGKLVLGTSEDDDTVNLSFAVLRKDTVNDYCKEFISYLEKYSDKDPVEYGIADFEPDTYQFLGTVDIPKADEILKEPKDALVRLDHDLVQAIKFTEFRLRNAKGDVMGIFKIYPKTNFLSRQNRFRFFLDDNVLTAFTKDLIVAPPRFDCIFFNEIMYIFKRSNFEKIFDYKKVFKKTAVQVFEYFENPKGYTIQGLDKVKEKSMDSLSKLRRLAALSKVVPYKKLTFLQLAGFAKQKNLDDPSFDLKKKVMIFKTSRAFFRLFEDMYVHSDLTNTDYIATRKIRQAQT